MCVGNRKQGEIFVCVTENKVIICVYVTANYVEYSV